MLEAVGDLLIAVADLVIRHVELRGDLAEAHPFEKVEAGDGRLVVGEIGEERFDPLAKDLAAGYGAR